MPTGSQGKHMKLPRFREDKATDMACRFLKRAGNTMSYFKLIKLMYIAERTALLQWGRSITFDRFVSMPRGPVLSRTYDLIMEEPLPNDESIFHKCISPPNEYKVALIENPFPDKESPLSLSEIDLIDQVYDNYGDMDKWKVGEVTHDFPEWEDPDGSSQTIQIETIFQSNGMPEPDVEAILSEIEGLAYAESAFK